MAPRRQVAMAVPVRGVVVHWKPVPAPTHRSLSVHSSWSPQSGAVPGRQAPDDGSHVDTPLQGSPSSHVFGVCMQPRAGSQLSVVQGLPSSQLGGLVGVHTPAEQIIAPHARIGSQSETSVQGMHEAAPPALQMGQATVWAVQSLLQPSHSFVLASSHCSSASRTPSPHQWRVQVAEHGSPSTPFCAPSSHSSLDWTTWSPQNSILQVAEHPSFESVLPSSHCSLHEIFPSPHSARQKREQPSQSVRLPSSHVSPGSMVPFPQVVGDISWHVLVQVADPVGPSSHCSPGSTTWLPHSSRMHEGEHPSPAIMLPSSHCSPVWTTWSPQNSILQVEEQPSFETVFPSSHCSPGSICPSPQCAGSAHAQAVHDCPTGQVPSAPSQTSPGSSLPFPQVPPQGVAALSWTTLGSGLTTPVMTGWVLR